MNAPMTEMQKSFSRLTHTVSWIALIWGVTVVGGMCARVGC